MSEEEKKAIERIDYIQDFIIENGQYNADINDMEYFSKVLNLIEKQQKEIEGMRMIITKDLNTNQDTISTFCGVPLGRAIELVTNGISKDKIRELIKNKKASIDDIIDNLGLNIAMLDEIGRLETEINSMEELLEE